MALRVWAYLLFKDAKEARDAHLNQGTATPSFQVMWPYYFHTLLARFLTDYVLHVSHHAASREVHSAREQDIPLAPMMSDPARN